MMDPNIWSNVPQTILELVFARLPLQSLIRLRLLSKEWNADLSSRAFQLAFCDGRPRGFAVVETERADPKRVWAYDARARSWHGLPLGYLPFSYLVAADGGLLCFAKYGKADERLQLVLCNPLTCTWRELPPAVGVQMIPKAFHMKVDMESRQYTIKFLGSHNIKEPEVFHIYSSESNSWVRLGWNRQPNVVGRYILVNVYHGSIHTYDIEPGASSSILYPPDFDHDIVARVEGSFLFQGEEGSLFLLKSHGGKLKEDWGRHKKYDSKWELFCRIPKAAELENYFFNVFLSGDVILLLGKKRHLFYSAAYDVNPEDHRDSEQADSGTNNSLMLMLDLSTKIWTDVTEHSIEPACLSKFIVELRLDAVP